MTDPRDIVDFSFMPATSPAPDGRVSAETGRERRWLGIMFDCCGVYSRVYQTKAGDAYAGNCPRCNAAIRVGIGSGGTSQRIFRAS